MLADVIHRVRTLSVDSCSSARPRDMGTSAWWARKLRTLAHDLARWYAPLWALCQSAVTR